MIDRSVFFLSKGKARRALESGCEDKAAVTAAVASTTDVFSNVVPPSFVRFKSKECLSRKIVSFSHVKQLSRSLVANENGALVATTFILRSFFSLKNQVKCRERLSKERLKEGEKREKGKNTAVLPSLDARIFLHPFSLSCSLHKNSRKRSEKARHFEAEKP